MKRIAVACFVIVSTPVAAFADCTLKNDTGHAFDVESNKHHHAVEAHKSVTIEIGPIHAKRDDGKLIEGVCKEGEHVKIVEENGAPVIKHDDSH